MPTIHDTAYPRLKSSVSEKELNEIYTPTADDFDLAHSLTHSTAMRIGFLVLLKTFQPAPVLKRSPNRVALVKSLPGNRTKY